MNKDLDDRLIPNGEYRDAQNISVGKSEADDIGALETVLGNSIGTNFGLNNNNLEVIGYFPDEVNDRIIVFLTDYDDGDTTTSNPVRPTSPTDCYIYEYTPNNNGYNLLVQGIFLNFSKSNPITGASLIEDLFFWTDNRNPPRKINITTAKNSSSYYTNESDISVAKYNPYEGISLLNKISRTTTGLTGAVLSIADTTGITKGMAVIEYANTALQPDAYVYVTNIVANTSVTLSSSTVSGVANGDTIYFISSTMSGQDITLDFNGGVTWPGDPDFLENRFVRFSYRFRFDDGEYSIMAPFTQIAFIPKQKGYFLSGQEDAAYRSTIVEFMENGVQDVKLKIPLPDVKSNIGISSTSTYKIISIDVLYKESDGLSVKVLDTVEINEIQELNPTTSNVYEYDYQSRKPFKTLPQDQTTRVYDKVPVKALAQEVASNRVIYGNFKDKYTAPSALNYRVAISDKNIINEGFDNWAEYPNHSLKQNRNYQVGFILADKFGRQSDVILSTVDDVTETIGTIVYRGSTVYAPYRSTLGNIRNWFGNCLSLTLNTPISSGDNGNPSTTGSTNGQPGLYANSLSDGFNIAGTSGIGTLFPSPNIYRFVLNGADTTGVPTVGSALRGQYKDYVYVTNKVDPAGGNTYYEITCDGPINQKIYSLTVPAATPDTKYAYKINAEGWYSYKVVVKQQEQDYYNVYLPGILNGFPILDTPLIPSNTGEQGKVANIVLINDNINKVPRDLSEVGPDQKQFRSSVQLYGRVENTPTSNRQYFPGIKTNTAVSISTAEESGMAYGDLATIGGKENLYEVDTNPLIARLTIDTPTGVTSTTSAVTNMTPFLAIYETDPVDSLLDIFWETNTVGLIADLNSAISTGYSGSIGWTPFTWTQSESLASNSVIATNIFPLNNQGQNLNNTTLTSFTATNNSNPPSSVDLILEKDPTIGAPAGSYRLRTTGTFVFLNNANTRNFQLNTIVRNNAVTPPVSSQNLTISGNLSNAVPVFTTTSQTKSDSFIGELYTLTGVNGSANTTSNTQQLKWSLVSWDGTGNVTDNFSIGETSGTLSKTNNTLNAGTYVLQIKLEDTYNGTNVATPGASSVIVAQTVIITSSQVGYAFFASEPGVFNQTCTINGGFPLNATCGTVLYYNRTTNSATPQVNDVIATGPNQNSSKALAGVYSYNCSETGEQNRRFFQITSSSTGVVTLVDVC